MHGLSDLYPIRSESDYQAALVTAERWFDLAEEPDPATEEGAYFDALITLIETYEARHHPIEWPHDPIAAIRFRIEQQGLTPKDLEPMIGRRNRVYEVLSGKRGLSMDMVRRLHVQLDIPAEALIGA